MPSLPCPHCDYNLAGVPEHRCPYCGNPFDPDALARAAEKQRLTDERFLMRLTWGPVLFVMSMQRLPDVMNLLWPPVLFVLYLVILAVSFWEGLRGTDAAMGQFMFLIVFVAPAGIVFMVVANLNARIMARRASARAEGWRARTLWSVQIGIGGVGCAIVVAIAFGG